MVEGMEANTEKAVKSFKGKTRRVLKSERSVGVEESTRNEGNRTTSKAASLLGRSIV
jgi:hypothetical protein